MLQSNRTVRLALALPGLAVPLLPFTHNVSPLDTLLPGWSWGRHIWLLSLPFFLAVPIFIWHARRLAGNRPSPLEMTGAQALSACAMISVLAFSFLMLRNGSPHSPAEWIVIFGSCWTLTLANILLLAYGQARALSRETSTEVFLQGGYLPNAAFSLIAFGWDHWQQLQIGAWIALLACLAYGASIALALYGERPDTDSRRPRSGLGNG